MKDRLPPDLIEGVTHSVNFKITQDMIDKFVKLTGDSSSLHTDGNFAEKSMYRNNVVHGMLPIMFLSVLKGLYPEGYSVSFDKISARFLKPIFVDKELSLNSKLCEIDEENKKINFEYSLKNAESNSVLTTGYFTIKYEDKCVEFGKSILDDPKIGMVIDPLEEQKKLFDEIQKGDEEKFHFQINKETLLYLHNFISMGISSDLIGPLRWFESCNPINLIVSCLFSTFVGMCIPGRYATFTGFNVSFNHKIELNKKYLLVGNVAFKSQSTLSLLENVSIINPDDEKEIFALGKINVKVNEAKIEMPHIDVVKNKTDLDLKDKVVLITGANGGLGQTTAKLFSLYGAKVIINYFQGKEEADKIVNEIIENKGQAIAIQADITDKEQVKKMVSIACEKYGTINILVNNAVKGFYPKSFMDLTWEDFQEEIDVTLKGSFNCCQEVIPLMLKNNAGKIINMATAAVDIPPPDQSKYVAAKSALVGLTRSLAIELASNNIQVNMVSPSIVKTDLTKHVSKISFENIKNDTPMKRNAEPIDVAKAIVFLASSLSSFTTGQKIMVTGGTPPFL